MLSAYVMNGSGSPVSNTVSIIAQYYRKSRDNVHNILRTMLHSSDSFTSDVAIKCSVVRDLLTMKHNIRYGHQCPLTLNEIQLTLEYLCTC